MQTLYLTIFEYNLNEQKQDEMTKLQTPNTYASCGRNDPARKCWLNCIQQVLLPHSLRHCTTSSKWNMLSIATGKCS